MARPILYLLVGYPGAGKTTVAKIIHEATGALHVWADVERHKMFNHPTHSLEESIQLYDELNERTGALLAAGRSVIFDTNFNFHEDRRKLRDIAAKHGAETVVVWVDIPKQVAKQRAVSAGQKRNGYHTRMSEEQFNGMVAKLESPSEDEKVIKIDGLELDRQTVLSLVSQYHDANLSHS